MEYTGYLMSEYHLHTKAIHVQYECVDLNADLVPGNSTNTNGGLPTLLKLFVMDYHVHHMILRRSSPVLCAINEGHVGHVHSLIYKIISST